MIRSIVLLASFTTGCLAPVDVPFDEDHDGLMGDEEATHGSDPTVADTDADGFLDGDEVDNFTDPTDDSDHPYTGEWPIDSCRNDIVGTGNEEGSIAEQFELEDQFGDTLRLHDFCGKAVMLIFSAEWCGPCKKKAATLEGTYQNYKNQGFIAIEVMTEQEDGSPADSATLERWADAYQLTIPVVADPSWAVATLFGADDAIPSETLLTVGSEIMIRDSLDAEKYISEALP